jgi:type VI secretion system protein ImpJ
MAWNAKVVWSEGMFLQPQHFQQQDRYFESILDGRVRPVMAYGWGFRSLEIDPAALAIGKVQILSARGVLPDGTPFEIPGTDPAPLPLDVGADVKDELIVLALPVRRPGSLEVDEANLDDSLARYATQETETADTALSVGRVATVQVGALRLRLLRERDAADVYSRLGVAQVVERRADSTVSLQRSYVPPMLHAGADPVLAGYLRELHGLLHQRGEALATRLGQPGRGGVAEIAEFLLLETINRAEPLFAHFVNHHLLHPERLYAMCVQLAGDLATFTHSARRAPEYPEYRHDALRESFAPVIAELRRSLSTVLEQQAVPIELQERQYGVRVAVIADKALLRSASFVLAVNAQVPVETLRARFPTQVKIGPAERLRDLVNLQLPGLALHSMPVAPRQLPFHAGFSYFEIERSGDLWKQLEQSGGMAMHVAGEFPGLEIEMWAIRG